MAYVAFWVDFNFFQDRYIIGQQLFILFPYMTLNRFGFGMN